MTVRELVAMGLIFISGGITMFAVSYMFDAWWMFRRWQAERRGRHVAR